MSICTCATCGYQWQTGQDGSHSCSAVMRPKLVRARTALQNILISSKWSGTPPTAYAKIAREGLGEEEPKAVKLSRNGLPLDANDWTVQDWLDLHEAIEGVIQKVGARHAPKPPEGKISGQCSHCHKPIGVCECNRQTLEHLRDSSGAVLKEMLANVPAVSGTGEPTITVHDGHGNNPRTLNRQQYDELVESGMMWEFHPDAPATWPHG